MFRQPLPGLPRVTPGYSLWLKSVGQRERGLRMVTPLALATRLLCTSQQSQNSRVAAAVLLDRWFVCKLRIFLSCDVVKGVGSYLEFFCATFMSILLKRISVKETRRNAL